MADKNDSGAIVRVGFNTPFAEQVNFFRQKLNLPTEHWDDILREAHDRAFVVAGAMKADLLADLNTAVGKSIAEGKSIGWFRKEFAAIVGKHGWQGWTGEGSPEGFAWRTRVVYQTNLSTSYAAGRYQQLTDPELLTLRPYWRYVHADGVANPRLQHVAWNGLTLPHDHPFWQTHFPPNGWGCHCSVRAVSKREYAKAEAAGLAEPPAGWDARDDKGNVPGIARGFDYAPGASVADELRQFAVAKVEKLPGPLANAFVANVSAPTPQTYWDSATAAGKWHDASFSSAPEWAKERIAKTGDPKEVKATPGVHAHCSWHQHIDMGGHDIQKASGQAVWRHEFGHHADGMLANNAFYRSEGTDFVAAMDADAKALIDAAAQGRPGKAQAARASALRKAYEDAAAEILSTNDRALWLTKRFENVGISIDDVEAALTRYTDFANVLQGIGRDARFARVVVAMEQRDAQGFLDALTGGVASFKEASATFNKGVVGEFSDLVGSATKNKVCGYTKGGSGHPDSYYKKATYMRGTECYANLFCLSGEGGLFWKRAMEVFTPKMLDVFING